MFYGTMPQTPQFDKFSIKDGEINDAELHFSFASFLNSTGYKVNQATLRGIRIELNSPKSLEMR